MDEIKLNVQVRKEIGAKEIKAVRREDSVPAVVYGLDEDPLTIKVDRRSYEKIMRHHRGQSVVFHLDVLEGDKKIKDYPTIVKEEQHDPVSEKLLHIDFKRISLTEEIEVRVPVKAKGEAAGVKKDGGSLDHILWELDIVCLPTNIPEKIDYDVSEMNIGDAVHVKDLALPHGVNTNHDPEAIVFSVVPPMKEEEAEPAEGEESVEPEVIKEKKPKEEAEAEEAAS